MYTPLCFWKIVSKEFLLLLYNSWVPTLPKAELFRNRELLRYNFIYTLLKSVLSQYTNDNNGQTIRKRIVRQLLSTLTFSIRTYYFNKSNRNGDWVYKTFSKCFINLLRSVKPSCLKEISASSYKNGRTSVHLVRQFINEWSNNSP